MKKTGEVQEPSQDKKDPIPTEDKKPPDRTEPAVLTAQSPVVQEIHISRRYNGKWEFTFADSITMLDVNRLVTRLRREFLRTKRISRMKRQQRLRESQKE